MVYIIIIVGVFNSDLLIKNHIDKTRRLNCESKVLCEKIIIQKYYNEGAMLNIGDRKPYLVVASSAAFIIGLIINFFRVLGLKGNSLLKLGLSFILGGALSNLFDRFTRKHVVDYFSFNVKAKKIRNIVFNISDMFIFIGTVLTVFAELSKKK